MSGSNATWLSNDGTEHTYTANEGSLKHKDNNVTTSSNNGQEEAANNGEKNPKNVDKVFITKVKRTDVEEVKHMLNNRNSSNLDPNFEYKPGKNALKKAVKNVKKDSTGEKKESLEMCKILLEKGVRINDSAIYAIEIDEMKIAEEILQLDHNECLKKEVREVMQERLNVIKEEKDPQNKKNIYWEAFDLKRKVYEAMSSPEYIIACSKKDKSNPFDLCISIVSRLRQAIRYNPDQKDFYKQLVKKIEGFMCLLIDEVQSTKELDAIVDCESPNGLIRRAHHLRLVEFIAHRNSQLKLTYAFYKNGPPISPKHPITIAIVSRIVGIFFLAWPLFHLLPNNGKFGEFMRSPNVNLRFHVMSELTFLGLLIAYVVSKSRNNDYLGCPPTILEWLIFIWVLGKLFEEMQEYRRRGFKDYLTDFWNYFDIVMLVAFVSAIITRVIDYSIHSQDITKIHRNRWQASDPRLMSVGFLSVGHLLAFKGAMRFMRSNRHLGPLRVTLAKMLVNLIQFFVIFALLLLAYAVSLTEIYWYYGTEEGTAAFCEQKNRPGEGLCPTSDNSTYENSCQEPVFSNLVRSAQGLFWALFGLTDVNCIRDDKEDDTYIDDIAIVYIAIYHVSVVFILLNMLIAMMTKSFDVTSENKDKEWKYYRTEVWLQFITQEHIAPPPMNMLVNSYFFTPFYRFRQFFGRKKKQANSYNVANEDKDPKRSLKVYKDLVKRYQTKKEKEDIQTDA